MAETAKQNTEATKPKHTETLKQNLQKTSTWERLLYMLLFMFVFTLIQGVLFTLTIVQFIIATSTNKPNENLQTFGLHLANYVAQVMFFLTHNEEEKPFPFGSWPRQNRYRSNFPKA